LRSLVGEKITKNRGKGFALGSKMPACHNLLHCRVARYLYIALFGA
jgi:hypothetical protein